MDDLSRLIKILGKRIKERHSKVRAIKNVKCLYSALIELNNMVGMRRLKNSIAMQVMRLIDDINSGRKNMSMLNTILYGPPGVGKTQVGMILAKIWYGLGFLNGSKKEKQTSFENANQNTLILNSIILFFIILLCYCLGYLISGLSYVYRSWGIAWLITLLFIVLLIIAIVLYFWKNAGIKSVYALAGASKQADVLVGEPNDVNPNEHEIITVVSRQDFVAGYLGQTAIKTKALLMKNLGKVLFIDEAYSLVNDERDSFGLEASTTLNLFLSEHPNEIVVIFAGYKNKLCQGVFRAQPGLARRCMWHFECQGYDGKELYNIFSRQAKKESLILEDEEKIEIIIQNNKNLFPSYGGDTERLLFFSKLEASRENFMSDGQSSIITPENVHMGIEKLSENNINSDTSCFSNITLDQIVECLTSEGD